MSTISYLEVLRLSAPAAVLAGGGLLVILADLVMVRGAEREHRRLVSGMLGVLTCVAAGLIMGSVGAAGQLPLGFLVSDPLVQAVQYGLLTLTAFACAVSVGTDVTDQVGEYFGLLLFAAVGMVLVAGTENLLMLFVALELMSLSFYVLTAVDGRSRVGVEAGLKYFLFGSTAAAFLLFGMSWLYGMTGTLELRGMARVLVGRGLDPMVTGAMVLVLAGLGFKIAAVPFHLWAPDVYEGAPTPSAAFIASGSKLASLFILAKVAMIGWAEASGRSSWGSVVAGWTPLVATMAGLSMVVGNLAALAQKNVKRLLAYSAVAQAGYMLVGLLADDRRGLVAVVFYAMTYAAAVLGAFAVVAVVERNTGDATLARFRGLGRRSPLLAGCLAVFLLSLAGLPPMAGFVGKFYLFAAALQGGQGFGLLWLVILGFAMSAVSFYYYVVVLKEVFVVDTEPPGPSFRPRMVEGVGVLGLAVLVTGLGLAPELLLGWLRRAAALAGF